MAKITSIYAKIRFLSYFVDRISFLLKEKQFIRFSLEQLL